MQTIHRLMDPCLQESTKHTSSEPRTRENAAALTQLLFSVPGSQKDVSASEDARLGVALQKADGHDLLRIFCCSLTHGEGGPDDDHGWKEDSWPEVGEEKTVGNDTAADNLAFSLPIQRAI